MMKKRRMLLGSIGFQRGEPKTRLGRLARHLERVLVFVAVLYTALHAYPQVLFAHSFNQSGITIYSQSELPQETPARVSEIASLVGRSELATPDQRHRVFVCNKPWLFRLFSPLHGESFAVSVPLTGNIFVADGDLASDVARSRLPRFNERSFSGLAAHEITHSLIRNRLSLFRALRVEDWIIEGYSDYIAGEGSFPEIEGLELLSSGRSDPSKSFQYLLWRKMVEHLVERRGLSFDEIIAMSGDADRIEAEMVAALKSQQSAGTNGGT